MAARFWKQSTHASLLRNHMNTACLAKTLAYMYNRRYTHGKGLEFATNSQFDSHAKTLLTQVLIFDAETNKKTLTCRLRKKEEEKSPVSTRNSFLILSTAIIKTHDVLQRIVLFHSASVSEWSKQIWSSYRHVWKEQVLLAVGHLFRQQSPLNALK